MLRALSLEWVYDRIPPWPISVQQHRNGRPVVFADVRRVEVFGGGRCSYDATGTLDRQWKG